MKKKSIFFLIFLLVFNIPLIHSATDEGYGEANDNLGQFTDSFENLDNITVIDDLIRNATLNCIELNATTSTMSYGTFDHGIEIVIEHNLINENLTNFPILLNISDVAGLGNDDVTPIFDEIGDSYLKIAITNQAQDQEYYVDVEYWNSTLELGYIWVCQNVSSLENTTLRFFFDRSVANNTAYIGLSGSLVAQNVWDQYFLCVLHLSEQTGNFLDSTSNNNDASAQGTVNRDTQFIDGGIDLLGTDDYVRIDTAGILDGLDDATIETWINVDVMGADRSLVSDWGLGEDIIIFYVQNAVNKYRFIWRNVGNADPHLVFGTVNINTWEYIATKYIRNDFAYGYENAVETIGIASGNTALTSPNNLLYVGINRDLGFDQNGQMDEVRVSSMGRSQKWINASYISQLDDLIDWLSFSTGGYELDGYFITDDHLNYTTGNSLVILYNASIPANTQIQIQFSNDNVTWGDNEGIPLDSNILVDGFNSIDLRLLNYPDIYDLVKMSTTDLSITPRLYQLRLVTTNGTGGGGVGGIVYIYRYPASTFIMIIFLFSLGLGIIWMVKKK